MADELETIVKTICLCLRQQGQMVSPLALTETIHAVTAEGYDSPWVESVNRFGLAARIERIDDPGSLSEDLLPCVMFEEKGARVLDRPFPGLPAAEILFIRPCLDDDEVPTSLNALLRSWRPVVARAAIAGILANILALAAPIFSAQVYDRVLPHGLLYSLAVMAGSFLCAALFEQVFRRLRSFFIEDALHESNVRLSTATHRRVLATRFNGATPPPGQLLRLLQDYDTIRDGFGAAAVSLLADVPFLILFLLGILLCDPLVAAAIVVMNLMITVISLLTVHRQRQLYGALSHAAAQRNQSTWEGFTDPETVRRIGASGLLQARFRQAALSYAVTTRAIRGLASLRGHMALLAQNLAVLCAVGLGAWHAVQGGSSAGVILAATMLSTRFTGTIMQILSVVPQALAAAVALKSVRELTSRPTERSESRKIHKPVCRGRLLIEAVSARYPGAPHPAVSGLALSLDPGDHLAVIGPPGSGKSTLERLITGILTPENGRVMLDDVDLNHLDPADLRKHVTTCPQVPLLFSGTVRDNLALDNGIPDQKIVDVLTGLGAEYVMPAGMGLDYEVADTGRNLSGGQRQLLSVARACLRPAPVMVFDEPTNGFDDLCERRVVDFLQTLTLSRTLVVLTHRPAVLLLATRTAVLARGKIVRLAPTSELIRRVSA